MIPGSSSEGDKVQLRLIICVTQTKSVAGVWVRTRGEKRTRLEFNREEAFDFRDGGGCLSLKDTKEKELVRVQHGAPKVILSSWHGMAVVCERQSVYSVFLTVYSR